MLEIKCPYCGKRSQNEFAYGGDATVKRPNLGDEVSTKEWDNFVYFRDNPRGKHTEYWHHVAGCRQWFKASSCLLYTSPSPRDATLSRMPSSA